MGFLSRLFGGEDAKKTIDDLKGRHFEWSMQPIGNIGLSTRLAIGRQNLLEKARELYKFYDGSEDAVTAAMENTMEWATMLGLYQQTSAAKMMEAMRQMVEQAGGEALTMEERHGVGVEESLALDDLNRIYNAFKDPDKAISAAKQRGD